MPKRKPKDPMRSPDLPHNWIERHIERLQTLTFHEVLQLDHWSYKRSRYNSPTSYQDMDQEWQSIKLGDTWGGPDVTAFFKRSLKIPQEYIGKDLYLDIDMDGGETQLSINDRMWQGLDCFRSLIPLKEYSQSANELTLQLEAFTINYPYDARRQDERDFHIFKHARLVERDDIIEACVMDIKTVFDAYMTCYENDIEPEIERFLLKHMEDACRLLGPAFTSRQHAQESAQKARELLRKNVLETDYFRHRGTINVCAHSHLDIIYLWPIKETFRKNGRTVSNMLSLLREYPDYIYSQSQPYLYEKLQENYPDLFDEVKEMIAAGRWDVIGATYVEPDGNLLGAESWVRQIMFGKRFLQEELGVDSKICWLPDVFGVMYTLPQILKKAGIDYFLTAKLNIWNDTNIFPYDSFRWRGPDGSEVITHFPPNHFAQDFNYHNMYRQWADYREKQTAEENLFIYGWGDGGGGPTREMVEKSIRYQRLPGLPDVKITKTEPFFDRLADKQSSLPIWDDELYMEGHRGTYTSKGDLKKQNRTAEALYRNIEILSSMTSMHGGPFIQNDLNEGWKLLLLHQFHDTLPGSHVPAAMPDVEQDYEKAFTLGHNLQIKLLDFLESRLPENTDILIINTLEERRLLVETGSKADITEIELSNGMMTPVQHLNGKMYFEADVPSMGWQTGQMRKTDIKNAAQAARFEKDAIETNFYLISFDDNGAIKRLYDKKHDREVLQNPGNLFQVFEDDPGKKFGAWDIAYHVKEYDYPITQTKPWEMIANGPLFARFRSAWKVLDNVIEQEMVVYAHDPRIDFHTKVDWKNAKKLLKVAFPLNIRSRTATYDLPFGHIERTTHKNTGWDQAKFEVYGHKWADLSEGDYGVALLNDCKYGYDCHENVLRLSLLRSPVHPSPDSDIGESTFSYALLPHAGDWRQGAIDKAGYAFNCPAIISQPTHDTPKEATATLPASYSLINTKEKTAIIEVIKQAEDGNGLILRTFDSHGTHHQVNFELADQLSIVSETNLLEQAERPVTDKKIRFSPYEIKTFRLQNTA